LPKQQFANIQCIPIIHRLFGNINRANRIVGAVSEVSDELMSTNPGAGHRPCVWQRFHRQERTAKKYVNYISTVH